MGDLMLALIVALFVGGMWLLVRETLKAGRDWWRG